jgi:uncharacterized protein (TIGR03435 family)
MLRVAACLMACAWGTAYGQPAAAPRFEVAAVRPAKGDSGSSGINTAHGRVDAYNVTLKRCIMGAYGIGPNQISGGPAWMETERFEITAKADRPVDGDVLMTMLQTLLAERFQLAMHRESRPMQVYVLDLARKGPKLEKGDGAGASTNNGRGDLVARNITMDRFAEVLSRQMDLPVVNRTGLDGVFNLRLQWAPERSAVDGPSVFTAIQEQLGLRLRAQKVPMEILVIDHAERPGEN